MDYINYNHFLEQKLVRSDPVGFEPGELNQHLMDWQSAVTRWALKTGRAGMFEECGLGKTPQQLSWSDEVSRQYNTPVLIAAPLAVSMQTKREGKKFGIDVNIAEMQADVKKGINITNYEKLSHFDARKFGGVVLDESSILKAYMGKTKRYICDAFADTPYKLSATATPAPNDLMELLNQAEYLGVMKSSEALSIWFIADQQESGKYKLKGHAEKDFWRWVASWAVCIEKPSDIGFSDDGYILPELREFDEIIPVSVLSEDLTDGFFREIDTSATGFYKEKHFTVAERAKRCAEISGMTNEQYMIWCDTNEEADALKDLLPDAIEVRGSDKPEKKEQAAIDFVDGKIRILISKPSIFGYGLNFQNCRNCVFCGLDYSFEKYYQTVRRFYRFGQTLPVNAWRVIGSTELNILNVINKKAALKARMGQSMAAAMREAQSEAIRGRVFKLDLQRQKAEIPDWLRSEIA